jgi:hypothetical protein
MILIFLKDIPRGKSKMLLKLINLLQENISMEINLKSVIKIKKEILLFPMMKQKMEIIMRKNHLKLMKRLIKKMKLMQEMILNHQRRRKKELSP